MKKKYFSILNLLNDIRFYLFLFFIIRIIGITNPPLDIGHNWRQVVVNMPARNFFEIDNNILYPRIDIAGEKSGITGMEFPLLNYLIYLLSLIFGFDHWYGRLINLIVSTFGIYFFYLLLLKYFRPQIALYATIILSVSIWFQFSRKIMPDTFSMSLMIMSVYYGTNYLEEKAKSRAIAYLLLYLFLMGFGALSKLSSAYILIVFVLYLLNKEITLHKKILFLVLSFLPSTTVFLWYFYWVPHLVDAYGFWHFFMGSDISVAAKELWQNFPLVLARFYDSAMKYLAFIAFFIGIYFIIRDKNRLLIKIVFLTSMAFFVFILKAGFFFYHHNYYIIPFVPVMALIAAYAIDKIKSKVVIFLILFAVFLENGLSQIHENKIKEENKYLLNIAYELDKSISRNDLILINSGFNPTAMYFAHRKGWVAHNDKISEKPYIEALQKKGLKYILIIKHNFGSDIYLPFCPIIADNENFKIYKVQ